MTRIFSVIVSLPLLFVGGGCNSGPADKTEAAAVEPDVVYSEENAAKLLARICKERIDGAAPAADWPETIRKSGNAWIVDLDTQQLPGGYPEQIVIEATFAGGHTGNAKR